MPSKRQDGIFVSYSAISDYLKCSMQVYYRIFEPELKLPNREMIIGNITHKVIEKAWQNLDVALGLGKSLCDKENVDAVGKQSVEHFIHTFFEKFTPLLTKEDKIEKFFKVKLYDDVYLVGKFDRITRGLVIDWKTNANPPKHIDGDPQFILYDLAYRLIYEKPAEGIYFASLKNGNLIRYTESKEHAQAMTEHIIPSFVADVRNKSFIKTGLFTGACYRCPYKTPCLGEGKSVLVSQPFVEE
jgi:CRISPR/Cas system-associated exonuclease Cas4 (RecB family)